MGAFLDHSRYLFVFAHPDDEIYSCAFMHSLVEQGKEVQIIYVTNGDYRGPTYGPLREIETLAAMNLIGVPQEKVHFWRTSEHTLLSEIHNIKKKVLAHAEIMRADCIIGHDFEGGHNGHDAVSFCTSHATEALRTPFYVFPSYYNCPEQRVWNAFLPGRRASDTLTLSPKEKRLKNEVMQAHKTQQAFFMMVKHSAAKEYIFEREILRHVTKPMDYTAPPASPVGYEFPGSPARFEDFKAAIAPLLTQPLSATKV